MASRRRSVLPVSKPAAPVISTTTSRRASLATMRPPALPKPIVKASVSAKTKKPTATSKKSQQMDDFVSGDQFDFQISESPVGPVTRALRSSIYHLPAPLPVAGKDSTRKSKLQNLSEEPPRAIKMTKQEVASPSESKPNVTPVKKLSVVTPVSTGSKLVAGKGRPRKTPVKKVQTQTPENSPSARRMHSAAIRKTPYVRLTILSEADSPEIERTPAKTVTVKASPKDKSPVASKKTPVKGLKTPAKSTKTPTKAVKTPAKASKILAKTSKTPAKASKTPAKTSKTPAKTATTPPKPMKAPAKASPMQNQKSPKTTSKTPAKPSKSSPKITSKTANKTIALKTATALSSSIVKPVFRSTTILKEIGHVKMMKEPLTAITNMPATFTPQAADPRKLLRKNMKLKVENQIDTRVTSLPNGSPYTLLQGYTENGSPAEQLVKLNIQPSRTTATKFITATPAPVRRTRTSVSAAAISAAENADVCDRSSKSIKRKLSMTIGENIESAEKSIFAEQSVFAEESVLKKQKMSEEPSVAAAGTHWITGDLGKICVIM